MSETSASPERDLLCVLQRILQVLHGATIVFSRAGGTVRLSVVARRVGQLMPVAVKAYDGTHHGSRTNGLCIGQLHNLLSPDAKDGNLA